MPSGASTTSGKRRCLDAAYFLAGGIMPYVFEQLLAQQRTAKSN
jgi:hypothetical protein